MAQQVNFALPQGSLPWVDAQGRPTQAIAQYMAKLDALIRLLAAENTGGLVNAANDAAAATAGVQINGLYRNGSAVMMRVN